MLILCKFQIIQSVIQDGSFVLPAYIQPFSCWTVLAYLSFEGDSFWDNIAGRKWPEISHSLPQNRVWRGAHGNFTQKKPDKYYLNPVAKIKVTSDKPCSSACTKTFFHVATSPLSLKICSNAASLGNVLGYLIQSYLPPSLRNF